MRELTPQLVHSLKHYSRENLTRDLISGIIVAIIALPLSIALALASGVSPEQGLYTAIVAGFVISALGGSKVQIAGPTAAFATIVAGIVARNGMDGLATATILAGIMLILMGVLRMGSMIRFIPYTITTGFTAGIAVTIFIGQLKDFFGLTFTHTPVETMEKLGNQMQHSYAVLDQIQHNLKEQSEDVTGGYQCSYPVFRGIYHMVSRLMERGGQSVYIMLCSLVDGKGNPMKEGERLEEMSVRLSNAIKASVRHGDIINQYGSGQFLILLINTTREDCDIIEDRINRRFIIGRQRTGVEYHVNSVICEA